MNKKLQFFKAQATGNDFIIIDAFNEPISLNSKQIQLLCDRHFGIGADGILFIHKDEKYDFRMRFFNPDGTKAKFCGNGGRAIVKVAHFLGYIKEKTTFIADDGVHSAYINDIITLQMTDVNNFFYWEPEKAFFLDTGTSHIVKFTKNLKEIDILPQARKIRYHKDFQPEGTNVNFVEIQKEQIFVRTYEKGVEKETLSCGTGVVASALAYYLQTNRKPPIKILTKGGQLQVSFVYNPSKKIFTNVLLKGEAKILFKGLWYENIT